MGARTILCPARNIAATLIKKMISIMFKSRDKIEEGLHSSLLTFPPQVQGYNSPDLNLSTFSNISEGDMVGYSSNSETEYSTDSDYHEEET